MRVMSLPTARSLGFAAFLYILFALVYLAVSASFAPGEIVYAAIAAGVASGMTLFVVRLADMEQRVRLRWLRHLLRPCADVVGQVWPLTRTLVAAVAQRRSVAAALVSRDFDPGSGESADDRGRRALVTLAASLGPAGLVLNHDVDCDRLTIAEVGRSDATGAAADPEWPV